ncbi:hypothetical protein Efla_003355 [Eimeria flavescens]
MFPSSPRCVTACADRRRRAAFLRKSFALCLKCNAREIRLVCFKKKPKTKLFIHSFHPLSRRLLHANGSRRTAFGAAADSQTWWGNKRPTPAALRPPRLRGKKKKSLQPEAPLESGFVGFYTGSNSGWPFILSGGDTPDQPVPVCSRPSRFLLFFREEESRFFSCSPLWCTQIQMQPSTSPEGFMGGPSGMPLPGYVTASFQPHHDAHGMPPAAAMHAAAYPAASPAAAALTDSEVEPKRRVTDRNWLVLFASFLLLCLFFVLIALTEGSPSRLYRGMNYQGKTCGVDAEVKDLPYLYFPLDPRESFASLMLRDGRCVAKCPTEEDVENGMTIPAPVRETTVDPSKTSAMTVEFLLLSPAYSATLIADAFCVPVDASLRAQMAPALNGTFRQMQFAVGSLYTAGGTVFGYLLLSVVLSFAFAVCTRASPRVLLAVAAVSSILLSFVAGGNLIKSGFRGVFDSDKGSFYSLDYTWAMFFGFCLLAIGCFLVTALFVARKAIAASLRVMECTAEALGDMQQIFIAPLSFSAATIVWVGLWIWAYVYIVSAGRVGATEIPMGLEQNGDIGILPLHRDFVWDARFIFFAAVWWFALFWVLEAIIAFSHFVIAYSATVWYFSPPEGADERDVGWFPPLVAMGLGSIHHTGSFAVGGLIMGATRPTRLLFSWAASKHLVSTEDSPVVQNLRDSFRDIMSPLTFIVDRFTSSGYIEMSISSKPFFPAMDKSHARLAQARSPATYLHGTVAIASAIGSLFISLLIGLMIYTTLTASDKYAATTSASFVAAPLSVSIFTAFAAFLIALQFMSVWDIVADTFMYCFLVESIQPPVVDENPMTKVHAPACLRELLLEAQRG